jgi:ribA/ribD-fused uncharacterized protein
MIAEFQGEYRFLSNFYPSPIIYAGAIYPTAEHLYQSLKCATYEDSERIRQAYTPGEAKRLGRRFACQEDWQRTKVDHMRMVISMKFDQNRDLRAKLVATGNQELVEGNMWHDTFWGKCDGVGENWLGRLLMAYRSFARAIPMP